MPKKCYGNGNCVGVSVGVGVGELLLLGKRYQECVQHEGALLGGIWYGSNGCLPFPSLPPSPGSTARCCDAKRTFKFSFAETSECCRRAVGQVLSLQANLKSVTR